MLAEQCNILINILSGFVSAFLEVFSLRNYNYFLLLPADTIWKLQHLQGAKEPTETLNTLNPTDVKGISA